MFLRGHRYLFKTSRQWFLGGGGAQKVNQGIQIFGRQSNQGFNQDRSVLPPDSKL